ncbi:MAG: CGNR zinc finger domain-containing protein [Thermoleophilia bacterium]|nr:CGNR zinc finger domain-containing protein [Thermoleophilia bacterium]
MVTSYAYSIEGAVLPVRVAGDVALDFCNTLAGWDEDDPKEYLSGYRELVLWAREAGLVDADQAARLADREPGAVLARARRLRAALRSAVVGDGDWELVAAEAERAAASARLTPAGWRLPERDELPVLAVARAAADFLLSEHPPVRACPGRQCGWLFLDPRGRRRWCSMATCGNRAKQRRYAERLRGG